VPTVLARVIGRNSFDVSTTAIGYLGFALTFPPGTVAFPITIDCCKLGLTNECCQNPGAPCDASACPYIKENPLNPCYLEDGVTEVSCLEFFSTPEQNACWTQFGTHSPSINTPGMIDIIEDGNSTEVGLEPIYIDNGTKTPVVDIISQKFYGTGEYNGDPHGSDLDGDGILDWVVGLPVIQCQNPGANCASGTPQWIVGAVCFDINEVLVTPEKIIKGRFLCPGDPLHDPDKCGHGSGPGGGDFGVRAQRPVLVD
jgi:hypothetical protein